MIRKYSYALLIAVLLVTVSCSSKQPSSPTVVSPVQEVSAKAETSSTASAANIDSLAQELVQDMAKQDYSHSTIHFDATMQGALPPNKVAEAWKALVSQLGKFQKILGTRKEKVLVYDVIYVTCQFEKDKLDTKVVFDSNRNIAGLFFVPSQEPAPEIKEPANMTEKDVIIGTGEWKLPGTLTIPNGAGPFPAVVLVHGSGPNDRDETIGPNKPFKDLAWGLGAKGIAVLRYEKRTKEYPEKVKTNIYSLTVKEETLDDVNSAVAFLQTQPNIDGKHIYILGHSLGGYLMPKMASSNPSAAGYIILAGTTRPLEDVMLEQFNYIFSLNGGPTKEQREQLIQTENQIKQVKQLTLLDKSTSKSMYFNAPASYWLDLRGYNPPEMSKSIEKPVLVLQGQRDYQVTTKDFDNWKTALSNKPNVQFRLYPKLNHLFIEGEGKSTPEEYTHPNHVAEYVISDIATWVKGK